MSGADSCDSFLSFLNNFYVHLIGVVVYRMLTAAHENTGERSSQYAAENSCRARYGPYTEWMASFDTGMI